MANKTRPQKKLSIRRTISLILAIVSILLGMALIFASTATSSLSPKSDSFKEVSLPANYPVKLYIPKLEKALDITDGQVVDDRWTVSATGVSYLTTSAIPGAIGNSVIYGHNRKEILGGLPKLSLGDFIYVTMKNGEVLKYEVFERKEISPTQVEILNETEDSRLTIYTCSGFLDQSRFVVIAKKV